MGKKQKGKAAKTEVAPRKKTKAKLPAKARAAAVGGPPGGIPYKCDPSGAPGSGQCLKFYWNPKTQAWDTPPEGEPVNCSDCKWFF